MTVLITCKFVDDLIKSQGAILWTTFSPLEVLGKIFCYSVWASNSKQNSLIWPEIELRRDVMPALIICKFKEDPINNEDAI